MDDGLPTGVHWPVKISAPVLRSMRKVVMASPSLIAAVEEVPRGIEVESARMVGPGPVQISSPCAGVSLSQKLVHLSSTRQTRSKRGLTPFPWSASGAALL